MPTAPAIAGSQHGQQAGVLQVGAADGAGADRVVPPAGGHQRVGARGAHLFQHGLPDGHGGAVLDSPGGVEAGE